MEIEQENNSNQLLTFMCGGELFGFDIMSVQDIIEIPEITPLPLVGECICGIMNLRGAPLPVMDFSIRMGIKESVYDEHSCIIVADCDGSPLGIKAEKVINAEIYDKNSVVKSPVENSCVTGYVTIGENRISVIDCMKLVQ